MVGTSDSRSKPGSEQETLTLELSAVIVAVTNDDPRVLVVNDGMELPSGPLEPGHRTLELGLRAWVLRRAGQRIGYVEQLYTFADRDRIRLGGPARVISLSYVALAQEAVSTRSSDSEWRSWYRYFPWEDWRSGANRLVTSDILPRLARWAETADTHEQRTQRERRIRANFGAPGDWNEDLVLQRYELLYETGLVQEADRGSAGAGMIAGAVMAHDHRRILATAIARLRAKIKYRPVVFELMPLNFTLSQLQRTVEALAGRRLHKQNFRRFITQQELVEETGEMVADTGGRPAKLVRFRHEVVLERAVAGTKLPLARSALSSS